MRYVLQISDVANFDFETLKIEIKTAGIVLKEIYAGNGALLFEIEQILTDEQKTALNNIVTNHRPLWFEWPEEGSAKKVIVRCAEDVDRLTAMRIRSMAGNSNPIDEQFKIAMHIISGLVADIANATSLADLKIRLQQTVTQYQNFIDKRKTIIAEGKTFKTGKGW